ncbi:MAG: dethiobiotin synthase [Campylobacterota bacterium]|nr:dethiobiotin synthase [Campylobacterota bacterium]
MKKEIYFITATNTDVGKSYASELFLRKFAKDGKRVGYFKPIETGVDKIPLDGAKLLKVAKELNRDFNLTIDDVVPYQFKLPAAPFVAKGDKNIEIDTIKKKADYLFNFCDILVVEGAGGLMVPILKDYFMIDLIKEFDCKTILIGPSNLGSINDTMLSIRALESYGIDFDWYINLYKDKNSFKEVTLPFYKEYFEKINFL